MHLFDASMHEPLTATPWDRGRAKEVAARITSDNAATWADAGARRPPPPGSTHERDFSFWTGAAGILWALDRLGHGVGEGGLLSSYHASGEAGESPGLMQGEAGVLLVSWAREPTTAKEERCSSSSRRTATTPPASCSVALREQCSPHFISTRGRAATG